MAWFNSYGLIIMVLILMPNIIYTIKHKQLEKTVQIHKAVDRFEQVGRYGSLITMMIHIPYLYFGFWVQDGLSWYLLVNGLMVLVYLLGWIVLFTRKTLLKALLLSITPTLIFIFSGVMMRNIPLILFGILFGIFHIVVSVKNHLTI